MPDRFEYDVFLSHNSADKPRVRKLAERLKGAGLRVWLDEWVIKPGDDIYLAIERGLESARVQVLCLSPAALGSEWVALERSTVLFRDPTNKGRRFVPLLLSDCDLPDTLRRYKYVDFRAESEAGIVELLSVCKYGRDSVVQTVGRTSNRSIGSFDVLTTISGVHGNFTQIAWSPNGDQLAIGSTDKKVRIWDRVQGGACNVLGSHDGDVGTVAWSPQGTQLASGSADQTVKVWDTLSGLLLDTNDVHYSDVRAVSWSPDGMLLASGSWFGRLSLQRSGLKSLDPTYFDLDDRVLSIAWSPDGKEIATGGSVGRVSIRRSNDGVAERNLLGHAKWVDCVVWWSDGVTIATASGDETIRIWNARTGESLAVLEGHSRPIRTLSLHPSGRLLASIDREEIRIWSCDSWTTVARIPVKSSNEHRYWQPGLAFHPSLPVLAALDNNDTIINLWQFDFSELLLKGKEPRKRYVNAKVVLLGEGMVGKTSLAHRLIEDKYVVKDRTHGMNVWPLQLPERAHPHPQPLSRGERGAGAAAGGAGAEAGDDLDREALLWDLAGQEDYRLIHRLFLNETALALLLINPQKDDPFAEAGDWLKALDTAAQQDGSNRKAARLAIFSQCDVGEPKLGQVKLDRFCQEHGFADWVITSAKNGRNCSDQENGGQPSKLKQLIANSIPWDKLPWTATPKLLAELKSAMLKMRDTSDIRLLRFAELAQRLEQTLPGERFGESEVRTAVTLLANHGLARQLKFGDLVLLQPELLNGYAGAVIRAARAHTDEIGCVREAEIYDPQFDFTGVERLKHRSDEELLLRAMVQTFLDHSLCIAEETAEGKQLVFPSQYRREKDLPHEPDVFVSYTFSGEWQTVWTTLVVRLWYSQEFAHRELWRNAAEFASPKGYTLGLKVENRQGAGTATISLYFDHGVPDELKVIFIEYVHRHLATYAGEVTRDWRYVCPACGKPVKDLDAVRRRVAAKKEFITCQECDEKVPFIDFIEERLKSDPVARKILAMEENATRELDTQALEQILIGHMLAIAGEANQIYRPVTMFDYGIDGEVEFKDNDGKASGKKIYIQLKSGNSYLRTRKRDGSEVFDADERHIEYWMNQPVDVYLVIRQTDEMGGQQVIRWMNVTRYLKARKDKTSRQIVFSGEKLDMAAVYRVRDEFFPVRSVRGPTG